jgi:hypothetical protein
MARSLIGAFVSGARGLLSAQLFISVAAVGLAGWTLAITNQLIRERDLLRERVIQLEASMAERGIVVPATQTVVSTPTQPAPLYPGAIGALARAAIDGPVEATEAQAQAAPTNQDGRDLRRVIGELFAPPPPMRIVVIHARAPADTNAARAIAVQLGKDADVHVVIALMPARDGRPSGYTYFDGRQSRAAADLVTQFHDIARGQGVAPWSAQLRGAALPAQGEYTADRVDLVLPQLPAPEPAPVAAPPVERAG